MINDLQKSQAEALLDVVFNTFREDIAIYQTPTKTYVNLAAEDPNYNFNTQHHEEVSFVIASGIFPATIEYVDQQDNQQRDFPNPNMPLVVPQGYVKICVSGESGRQMLKSSERIVFDDTEFKLVSDSRPRGLFNRKYTDFWLQKIDQ